MEKPTWVTVTGILGIVFAVFGVLGAAQMLFLPKIGEMQKQSMGTYTGKFQQEIQKESDQRAASGRPPLDVKRIFQAVAHLWDVPDWFKPFTAVSALVGLMVSAFYLYASLKLLGCNYRGLSLFKWALGVSAVFHALKGVVAVASLTVLGIPLVIGSVFWLVVNLGLYLAVRMGDKKAFKA